MGPPGASSVISASTAGVHAGSNAGDVQHVHAWIMWRQLPEATDGSADIPTVRGIPVTGSMSSERYFYAGLSGRFYSGLGSMLRRTAHNNNRSTRTQINRGSWKRIIRQFAMGNVDTLGDTKRGCSGLSASFFNLNIKSTNFTV